jgi:hypothetical protein
MATDTRYVYGARCTWHGSINAIGRRGPVGGNFNLPCCPHCGGMLFELGSKAEWDAGVTKHDAEHPGYADFVAWLGSYGRCWPNHKAALELYTAATGKVYNG